MHNSTQEIILEGKSYPLLIKNFASSKSIKLRVYQNYILITKAKYISKTEALKFIESNKEWILSKLKENKESLEQYLENIDFLALGEEAYKVILVQNSSPSCIVNHAKKELLFSYTDNTSLAEMLLKLAKEFLPKKLKSTAQSLGIDISKISIRSQRSLWGSRSSSGMLSLNWRLILLPQELQNYVICHELAHIKFMDHSTSFWIYLNSLCPNARRLDKALTECASRIFKLNIS